MEKTKIKKFSKSENTQTDVFESGSGYSNDYIYQHSKELKMGESLAFRFITLDSDYCPETKQVACSVLNPKTNKIMTKVPVPQPDLDDDEDIFDDDDNSLRDLMQTKSHYRSVKKIPVWLISKLNEDLQVTEEIGKLAYIEVNYALLKSFNKMKENVNEDSDFEDGLPPYTVLLVKGEGNMEGMPQYDFKPCKKIRVGKKVENEPTFGEADPEVALGEEVWDEVTENVDELIKFLYDLRDEETSADSVRRKFVRYRQANNSGSKKSSNVEVDDVDSVADEIEEAQEEDEEPTKKKTSRKWER